MRCAAKGLWVPKMRTKAGGCIRLDPNIAPVQEWLGSINIKFYESKINLNWKPILKSIIEVRVTSPGGFPSRAAGPSVGP